MCAGSSQEDALYLSNLRDTAEVKWSYFYQLIIVIIVIRLIIIISWTMLRSKELRESLSRPSSRLSCENGMEKMGKDLVRKIIIIAIIGDNDDRTNHNISIRNILMFEGNIMLVLVLVPMCNCHYWSMVMFPTLNLLTSQDGFRDWGFWNLS